MSREATHAGIGVVEAPKEANKPSSAFVIEVFVKELPPVDLASLREKLKAAIKQKRAENRNAALASDATLDSVARKYVKEFAGTKRDLPKATADQILAPIYKSFRSVNMLSGAKAEPLDFAAEPGVKE